MMTPEKKKAQIKQTIEVLLPPDALHVAKVAEQSEREHICRMADLMENGA